MAPILTTQKERESISERREKERGFEFQGKRGRDERETRLILGIAIPAFFVFWVIVVIFVCSMSQSKRRRAAAIAATNAGQHTTYNLH